MHICFVTSKVFAIRDGVGDYAFRLAAELAREHRVTLITSVGICKVGERQGVTILPIVPNWGPQGLRVLAQELFQLQPDVVNLQYEPHLYHRWGINLWLPVAMLWLRWHGLPIITTVHEPYVPFTIWQWWITGTIQRLALALLICASRKVVVTISAWTKLFQRRFRWRSDDFVWIPVGTNVYPVALSPEERQAVRSRWGLPPRAIVVAVFSPLGSGKQFDLVVRAWETIERRHADTYLLMIGVDKEEARRREPEAPTGDRVVYTGFVSCFDEEAPHLLQCADLAIAPFVDGLSARRGSTITMMAQSLPMISTRGPLTDMEVFDSSPIRLLPVGDEAGFIGVLEELVRLPELRARLGSDTRLFFERHFGWDVIAKRVADVAAAAA